MSNKVFCRQDRRRWAQFCRESVVVEQQALVYFGSYASDGHEEFADYQEPRVKHLHARANSSFKGGLDNELAS